MDDHKLDLVRKVSEQKYYLDMQPKLLKNQ